MTGINGTPRNDRKSYRARLVNPHEVETEQDETRRDRSELTYYWTAVLIALVVFAISSILFFAITLDKGDDRDQAPNRSRISKAPGKSAGELAGTRCTFSKHWTDPSKSFARSRPIDETEGAHKS